MSRKKPYPLERGSEPRRRLEEEFSRLNLHTDEDVCRHFDITPQQYTKIVIGDDASLSFAMLLAERGVDVTYWLTGSHSRALKLKQDELTLIKNYREADDSGQKALRRVGSALAQSLNDAETAEGN